MVIYIHFASLNLKERNFKSLLPLSPPQTFYYQPIYWRYNTALMVDAHIAIIEHGKTTQILTIRSKIQGGKYENYLSMNVIWTKIWGS